MSPANLKTISDEGLVQRFGVAAVDVGEAVVNWLPVNRKMRNLFAIRNVLRERGPESRLKLAALLDDDNRFVRYYAARELLTILPSRCRPIIEENTTAFDAIAGDAGMCLYMFDKEQ